MRSSKRLKIFRENLKSVEKRLRNFEKHCKGKFRKIVEKLSIRKMFCSHQCPKTCKIFSKISKEFREKFSAILTNFPHFLNVIRNSKRSGIIRKNLNCDGEILRNKK